jgi:hypothetical protein
MAIWIYWQRHGEYVEVNCYMDILARHGEYVEVNGCMDILAKAWGMC